MKKNLNVIAEKNGDGSSNSNREYDGKKIKKKLCVMESFAIALMKGIWSCQRGAHTPRRMRKMRTAKME